MIKVEVILDNSFYYPMTFYASERLKKILLLNLLYHKFIVVSNIAGFDNVKITMQIFITHGQNGKRKKICGFNYGFWEGDQI